MSKVSSSNLVHDPPPQHQVFINFRGTELRNNFISHLEKALLNKKVNVFIDIRERMGKDKENLFQRIRESRITIAVISSKYTESKWCLNELAEVQKCVKAETMEVFPVFYKVDVGTVEELKGEFGENFKKLVEQHHSEREKWERALKFVTTKLGLRVDEKSFECDIIDHVVEDVMKAINEIPTDQGTKSPRGDIIVLPEGNIRGESESSSSWSSKASPFFGIETRLEQLKEKLDFESNEVTRVVGVVGMPGIGKTTLAKKVLEDWGYEFSHTMFLDDVREKSKYPEIHNLQMELLCGLTNIKYERKEQTETDLLLKFLKVEVSKNKVLFVIDDVSEKSQIEKILGEREWLKEGSKVLITTNSKSVVKGMVNETYLVPGLSDNDALNYFERHAFSVSCEPSFMQLAREFVEYSRGNPLALKVLGSELLGKQKSYWESKLGTLAKSPISNTIQNVLRIPYDDLSLHHKNLFLDVACFFRFEDEYHVRSFLDSSVHENVSEIKDLADKFLINICGGRLEINDLMYTFAMGLESQSSSEDCTSGRRLSNHGEIITVLRNKVEATKVRGIFLDMSEVPKEMKLSSDTFKEMNDLRYLKFFDSSCPKECEADCNLNFPNGLRPQAALQPARASLEGREGHVETEWLDLNHSSKLRTLSGLSLARKLQSMNLEGCTKLETVHHELKNMESLLFLNLRGCTSLESLPKIKLISLKTLILSGCSNLDEFNLISENLEELYLDGTAIKGLPSDIGDLQRLVLLKLKDCKKLLSLPDSIRNLKALEKLILSGCSSLVSFPEVKQNLKHLKTLLLDGTAIKDMHDVVHRLSINQGQVSSLSHYDLCEWRHGINGLSSVQRLCLSRNDFTSLPESIIYLYNLKWLDLKYCKQLTSLPMLPPNLHWLDADGCISLKNIEKSLSLLLAATEQLHSTFIFSNCKKLDQVAKNGIVSYVRRKIQLMSDALVHKNKGSILDVLIKICYPGWQLPVWFDHRSVGSELKQKLPRHWNEDGLTGIALCVVVSFKDYKDHNTRLLVRCTSEFKEENAPLIQFSCILGGWTKQVSDNPGDIVKPSGHVFIGYTNLLHVMKRDRGAKCVGTEVSFRFEVTDGAKQVRNCEVLKCGFTLIYAPTTKPVHSLCTQVYSDHGEQISGSTTAIVEERYNQHETGATSVSLVAPTMASEVTKEVQHYEAKSNVEDIQNEAPSRNNVDANTESSDHNTNGGSMSPGSSGEGEVFNNESPKKEETNATSSALPLEDNTNENGTNNLCERLEKPIRLICLVISIYLGAAFVLRKDNKRRSNQ
ncbi:P-loop containing nucleoside triphosphate hydrolase [Arabidopsis thaliana x Arabidopsis arenosa]|uniref:P-loop containing nucleoside triphosphate hydrolase n=1 Tax=Arabidopsis thaliana x Arabidopsis arenosa TaxID=1240361 RepID=A0A8T1XDS2_9BRAS|nr:P-loop containing nucleoside triphosphate hydrolase [Arabidopsis thaliana x Arabidopsis arenosa]